MMSSSVGATNNGATLPEIVVDKIIDLKTDENGQATFCIKWENTWVNEQVMSSVFPDLLSTFKETDKYITFFKEEPCSTHVDNACSNERLADALNLMELSTHEPQGKSHESYEVLNLFLLDYEFCELVEWRLQKEMRENGTRRSSKRTLSSDAIDVGRSKRLRKPTAKKIASDENEKSRYLNSPKGKRGFNKRKGRGDASRKVPTTNAESVQCEVCGRVVRKKRLESHLILHSNNSKYTCETCGKICGTKSDLQNHMLIHGEFNYQCEYCDQKFKQPAPYRIHMKMHTVEMNWMCDICFQTFKYQGELKTHCMDAHADIGKDPQRCCICKEMLKSPNSVYRHSVGHTGVRSFECGVCGKKFKHKGHLEKHLLMHERLERKKHEPGPEGPFQCEVCGKEFPFLQSIKIHLGKHKANQENNLEEFLEKKAQRQAASRERYRQNAKEYKAKYKEMQTQKLRILKELGIEPDSPIAKTIDFKSLMKNMEQDLQTTVQEQITTLQQQQHDNGNIVEVETNMVDDGSVTVLADELAAAKAVEYVVSEGSATAVVVQDGEHVAEVNLADLDSGFALLNFLRQSKSLTSDSA